MSIEILFKRLSKITACVHNQCEKDALSVSSLSLTSNRRQHEQQQPKERGHTSWFSLAFQIIIGSMHGGVMWWLCVLWLLLERVCWKLNVPLNRRVWPQHFLLLYIISILFKPTDRRKGCSIAHVYERKVRRFCPKHFLLPSIGSIFV